MDTKKFHARAFYRILQENGISFFSGVPDSTLKSLCNYLFSHVSKDDHVICANEGAAVALGVGYHLATDKIPAVYMQNSGLGNAVNPLVSIADPEVYSIPILLIIGWRGKPGEKDEPQHKKQGRITLPLLDTLEIPYVVLNGDNMALLRQVEKAKLYMESKRTPFALVVSKGLFESYIPQSSVKQGLELTREGAIRLVINSLEYGRDFIVSTTGMTSRELFEYREEIGEGHGADFLTVGGMGHACQIALGIAMQKADKRIVCIDGDGAVIMHMGSLAINGLQKCRNFLHVVINNGSYDSVGGQPTVGFQIDFRKIALAVGYESVFRANNKKDLSDILRSLDKNTGPVFLEIFTRRGARKNLGRPTLTPLQNKANFMRLLA